MAQGDVYIRGLKKTTKDAHFKKAKKQQKTTKPNMNLYFIRLLVKTSGLNGKA